MTRAFSRTVPTIVELELGADLITTTPEHPFRVQDRGWVPAGELRPGDCVDSAAGECEPVQAIRLLDRPTLVYNFTVAEVHSYFIGEGQWWVHHAPCAQLQPYEVGTAAELEAKNYRGSGLQVHHLPQKQPAGHYALFPWYDPKTAPAIALPRAEHEALNRFNLTGNYWGSASRLIRENLIQLYNNTNTPTESVLKLIDLIRKTYPGVF